MPYDNGIANRIRSIVMDMPGVEEKKMFGGLAFLVNGKMSVGVHGSELVVRIAPDESDDALSQPGVRLFDITGRPMKGWLLVSSEALKIDGAFAEYVNRGVAYAQSLPAK